jgi:hypothetical protein
LLHLLTELLRENSLKKKELQLEHSKRELERLTASVKQKEREVLICIVTIANISCMQLNERLQLSGCLGAFPVARRYNNATHLLTFLSERGVRYVVYRILYGEDFLEDSVLSVLPHGEFTGRKFL